MSKKFWIITGGSILTVFAGIAVTVFTLSQIGKDTTPHTSQAKVPETFLNALEEPRGDKTYADASGFSFKYPKDVTVTDTTPDDAVYYTQLTLKKDASIILISIRDSKTESSYTKLTGAVQLGGLSAKQYNTGDRLITTAYDQGVLYIIDAPAADVYMGKVYDLLISSFLFSNNAAGKSGNDPNAIYEEETIE